MNQIKNVNLFGYGYWGSKIAKELKDLGFEVNLIDPNVKTTINDANPEWPAIVATPTNTHYDLALDLILRGYDVMIEKPVSTSAKQIEELIAYKSPDQIVMPGHLYMFHDTIPYFESLIKNSGTPKFIHFVRTNFGRYQTDVDVLHNISLHDFTMLRRFYDDIQIKYSKGFDLSNNKVPDRAIVMGTADGVPFQIEGSWFSPDKQRKVMFYSDKRQIIWDDVKGAMTITNFVIPPVFHTTDHEILPNNRTPLGDELSHFLHCCTTRAIPMVTLQDALEVEKLINAAITSRS